MAAALDAGVAAAATQRELCVRVAPHIRCDVIRNPCPAALPPGVQHLFGDVYAGAELLPHLAEQRAALAEHMALYPDSYQDPPI